MEFCFSVPLRDSEVIVVEFLFQGKQGVSDVLEILKEEFKIAMILAGICTVFS